MALDPIAVDKLTPRGHPGIMQMRRTVVPERLENAINLLTEKYPTKDLVENSESLNRYLWARHPPMPDDMFKKKAADIMNKVKQKDSHLDVDNLTPERLVTLESKWKGHALQILRQQTYHWKPVTYDPYRGFLYMVIKMPQEYAVLLRIFTEILKRVPVFLPRAIFDLGSGCGSTIWAANKIWDQNVFQYYCVDPSASMNTLARLLLQDGEGHKEMSIPGIYFRQFMPSSQQNSYNMVVCAYTLFEFPNVEARLANISALWEMTEEFLVIVDNGTYAGYTLVMEARDYILKISENSESPALKGHVFAPCPHDFLCPKMLLTEKKIPCSFEATYRPLKIVSLEEVRNSVSYSYVIMRKGLRQPEDTNWPRIVEDVLRKSKHVHAYLCCPNGKIEHKIMTAKKTDKILYRCSRFSRRGDLLPMVWKPEDRKSSCDDPDASPRHDRKSSRDDPDTSASHDRKSSHDDRLESSHIKLLNEDNDLSNDDGSNSLNKNDIKSSLGDSIQSRHDDHRDLSDDDHGEMSHDDGSQSSRDDHRDSSLTDRSEMSIDDHGQSSHDDSVGNSAPADSGVFDEQTDFNAKEIDPNKNILLSQDCRDSLTDVNPQSMSSEADEGQCTGKDEPLPT